MTRNEEAKTGIDFEGDAVMSDKHAPLTIWQEGALKCLDRAHRRDSGRRYSSLGLTPGCRSAREVADYISVSTDQARAVLHVLVDRGLVDMFDDTPIQWALTDAGRAALAKAGGAS